MSDPGTPLVHGVIVSHGRMAEGMIDAVRRIAGESADALVGVSNEGKGPDELLRIVDELAGEGPAIIFTDLQTGSCALAARFACRDPEGRRVLCGANLPMLLDFVFHRDMALDALSDRLVEKARAAVRTLESGPR